MKKFEELHSEFNALLEKADDQAPFLSGAIIAGISFLLENYTEKDWKFYEEETGNNRPIHPAKDGIGKLIDGSCGLEDANKIAVGQFSLWFATGFLEGFNAK